MIKILHIADVHLGRRFSDHPEIKDILANARHETLESIVKLANERKADILSIGGDLFERISVNVSEIQRTTKALNAFTGKAVIVLPGNHDFITEDSNLWNRFAGECEDHVILLRHAEPGNLQEYDLNAIVYPAPCHAKHSENNVIGWINEIAKDPELVHIGIAHGSIEGVSPDFEGKYYPMTQKELSDSGVDLWLLGHTHITWPEKPGSRDFIFNPGTPEPDGFDCRHEGHAFFITVNEDKEIKAEVLNTGPYRFVRRIETLENEHDLKNLASSLTNNNNSRLVLNLIVSGHLDPGQYDGWKSNIPKLRESVLELRLDDSKLMQRVTAEQIRQEFPEGSFPQRLLSQLNEENDEQALQMAYQLIQEAKGED